MKIFDALEKQVYACFMLIQRIYFIKCVNLLPHTSIFAGRVSNSLTLICPLADLASIYRACLKVPGHPI